MMEVKLMQGKGRLQVFNAGDGQVTGQVKDR